MLKFILGGKNWAIHYKIRILTNTNSNGFLTNKTEWLIVKYRILLMTSSKMSDGAGRIFVFSEQLRNPTVRLIFSGGLFKVNSG